MRSKGGTRWFEDEKGAVKLSAKLMGGLCVCNTAEFANALGEMKTNAKLWHQRLLHTSPKTLKNMKNAVKNLDFEADASLGSQKGCGVCMRQNSTLAGHGPNSD